MIQGSCSGNVSDGTTYYCAKKAANWMPQLTKLHQDASSIGQDTSASASCLSVSVKPEGCTGLRCTGLLVRAATFNCITNARRSNRSILCHPATRLPDVCRMTSTCCLGTRYFRILRNPLGHRGWPGSPVARFFLHASLPAIL